MNRFGMEEQVFLKFHFEEPSRVLFSIIGSVVDPSCTHGIKASPEKCEDFLMFFDQKSTRVELSVSDRDTDREK